MSYVLDFFCDSKLNININCNSFGPLLILTKPLFQTKYYNSYKYIYKTSVHYASISKYNGIFYHFLYHLVE